MSIELAVNMTGEKEEFEHRMDHDIESLLHVFLHIVRFTPGPQGDPSTDIKVTINEIRISQWHHECLVANIPQLKSLDILRLRNIRQMESVLPAYWRPLAPNIIRLIDIVYPQATIPMCTGKNIATLFKQELMEALDKCHKLEETPHRYGTSMPYQTRFPPKKRKAVVDDSDATSQSESESEEPVPVPVKVKHGKAKRGSAKRGKTAKR